MAGWNILVTGRRLGFRVTTLDGRQDQLARVGLRRRHVVGGRGAVLATLGLISTLRQSRRWRPSWARARVLATVGRTSDPFLDALREGLEVELLSLIEPGLEVLLAELCARWRGG